LQLDGNDLTLLPPEIFYAPRTIVTLYVCHASMHVMLIAGLFQKL